MIYAAPSASVEATFNIGDTGLVGTAGVRVLDGQGATTTARVTTGIVESPAGSGIYIATITAPSTAAQYQVVFDDGAASVTYLTDDLTVTEVSMVSVVSGDFTYDIATTLGKVRFKVGDTDESGALFTDAEINYELGEFGDNIFKTAAALCDVLATRYAGDYDFKTDDQSFSRSQRAKMYRDRAADLRARAPGAGLSTVGVTRVDGHSNDLDQREGSDSRIGWAQSLTGDITDLP